MGGALSGLKIVEFAGLGPGPFCGTMLADHGAEVIRIDRIAAEGLLQTPDQDFTTRSRSNLEVDLKSVEGLALVRRLCATADAVFEGYRPGVMERLGLGPEVLLEDNPRLVYGRMTGFGQDGPYSGMAGHDINYIALSGVLHGCGRAGHPPTAPMNLVGDFGGGGMFLAFGIVAAILAARTTGRGQVIDCAMTEGSAMLMAMTYSLHAAGLWEDDRGQNFLDTGAHYYDTYETADGKFISLGPVEPQFYRKMLQLVGLDADPAMQAQNDRRQWPQQKVKMASVIAQRTRAEWCALLEGTDSCFAPVLSLKEAPLHPHNLARAAFVSVDGQPQPAPAPRFSGSSSVTPRRLAKSTHVTAGILAELGLDKREIERLQSEGVVR